MSSFEHTKHMLKLMDKKIFTFLCSIIRNHHECEGGREKSVLRIIHRLASRGLPSDDKR